MIHATIPSKNRTQKKQSGLGSDPGWTSLKVTAKERPSGEHMAETSFCCKCGSRKFTHMPEATVSSWVKWVLRSYLEHRRKDQSRDSWTFPFPTGKKKPDLTPVLFLEKSMCQSILFLFLSNKIAHRGYVVIIAISSIKLAFCRWMSRHLSLFCWWFLILSSLFFLM